MLKSFDIHHGKPTVTNALSYLETVLFLNEKREIMIKIIHGYGSTGVGGKIKIALRQKLMEYQKSGRIHSFIPGEAFAIPLGYDELIHQFKKYLQNDPDFKKANDGITYVIFPSKKGGKI